jgi:hypothetical protein
MRIWDAVSKTDPAHTKHVGQRGGFTAINANYQIMMATKQFGPIGDGWGYDNGDPIFHDRLVIVPVTLWHGDRTKSFGPVYGCAEWQTSGGKLDSDAPKKAATDGLTKLLSQLGFNADVFLGMYDDQKYVAEVAQEFAEKKAAESLSDSDLALIDAIEACNTADDLDKWTADHGPSVAKSPNADTIRARFKTRRAQINPPQKKAA